MPIEPNAKIVQGYFCGQTSLKPSQVMRAFVTQGINGVCGATKSAMQLFFALLVNPLWKPVQSLNHFSVPPHHRSLLRLIPMSYFPRISALGLLRENNERVLMLARELSKGTIDKVMAKSDVELGLEMLMKDWSKR